MKYLVGILFLCLLVLSVINSCKNDSDCNVPCFFGTCVNNSCNCNLGYEGDSCTILTSAKFIGEWTGVDSCEIADQGYTATIAASSSVLNQIIISNFGRFGTSFAVTADVSGFTFTIPSQNVQGITLSGSGTVDTVLKQIEVSYSASDALGGTDHCNGLWIKEQ